MQPSVQPGTSQPGPPPDHPSEPEPTGEDPFAQPRADLESVADRPLAEHAEVFAAVHSRLQAALAEIDGL